jgi:hypothetical protein
MCGIKVCIATATGRENIKSTYTGWAIIMHKSG